MDIFKQIEDEQLEFKRGLPSGARLAKEVVAFANCKGGRIVIGYDEKKGEIVGVEVSQRIEEKVANIISDLCKPMPQYQISYETVTSKTLLIIDVLAGENKPYRLASEGVEKGAYIRVGSTSRVADAESLSRLFREGKNRSYDSEIIEKDFELSKELLQDYSSLRTTRLLAPPFKGSEKELESIGLKNKGRVTVAGALLFSENPQEVPSFGNASIKAARFSNSNPGLFLDIQEITGPLTKQIDLAASFIMRNLPKSAEIKGLKRIESPLFPAEIVREMVVNAVIHRDYSIQGASIRISVYDDYIEIASPGGLPGLVTEKDIATSQYSRNPIIAKRMFEMGYFDEWGQGIDKILRWARENDKIPPVFEDRYNQFTLRMYAQSSKELILTRLNLESELENKVVGFVIENDFISNKDCREEFSLSKTQAQVLLKELVGKNIIESVGNGRSRRYRMRDTNTEKY